MMACLSYATVSIVWGSTFLGIAYAIDALTPFGLSAARFIPAGLIALVIAKARRRSVPGLALILFGVAAMQVPWSRVSALVIPRWVARD